MPRQVTVRSRIDVPTALWDQLKAEARWVQLSPGTYASLLLAGLLERPSGPVDLTEQAIRRWELLARMAGDMALQARSRELLATGDPAVATSPALPEG